MAATPSASVRTVDAGRPSATPTAATAAIPAARSTEGSARVTRAKPASTASVATSRGPKDRRDSSGASDHHDEGDVLPRHGQQVRQAGGPEGVGHVGRLRPVVAEGEARQQAALALGQHLGARRQRAAQAVGRGARRVARTPPDDGVDHQAARDVPVADEALVRPGTLHRADHRHPLPREAVVERGGGRGAGHRPQPAVPETHVDADAAPPVGIGVAHERHLPPHRPGVERGVEARHAALTEGGGEERQAGAHQRGRRGVRAPTERPRCDDHRRTRRQRHRREVAVDRDEGGGEDDGAEHDRPPIAHVEPPIRLASRRAPPAPTVTPWPGRGAARAWPRRCRARRAGRRPRRRDRSPRGGRRSPRPSPGRPRAAPRARPATRG